MKMAARENKVGGDRQDRSGSGEVEAEVVSDLERAFERITGRCPPAGATTARDPA